MDLPIGYRWLKANGFKRMIPWHLLENVGDYRTRGEYRKETKEEFYPFAYRQDCDDVAGFVVIDGKIIDKVVSVHLTWSGKKEPEGFPIRQFYSNVFEWLKELVIEDIEDWMTEDAVEDLEERQNKARDQIAGTRGATD